MTTLDEYGRMIRSVLKNTEGWKPENLVPVLEHNMREGKWGREGAARLKELAEGIDQLFVNTRVKNEEHGDPWPLVTMEQRVRAFRDRLKSVPQDGSVDITFFHEDCVLLVALCELWLLTWDAMRVERRLEARRNEGA